MLLQQPACLHWIQPVVPPCPAAGYLHLPTEAPPPRRRVCDGGVDFRNLRLLRRTSTQASEETTISLPLLNARSLASKTFILNDFFTSCDLDFMFLTETWIQIGESVQFSELLPPDCVYFSSPEPPAVVEGICFQIQFSMSTVTIDLLLQL